MYLLLYLQNMVYVCSFYVILEYILRMQRLLYLQNVVYICGFNLPVECSVCIQLLRHLRIYCTYVAFTVPVEYVFVFSFYVILDYILCMYLLLYLQNVLYVFSFHVTLDYICVYVRSFYVTCRMQCASVLYTQNDAFGILIVVWIFFSAMQQIFHYIYIRNVQTGFRLKDNRKSFHTSQRTCCIFITKSKLLFCQEK